MIRSPCLLQLSLHTSRIWPQKQAGLLYNSPSSQGLKQPLPRGDASSHRNELNLLKHHASIITGLRIPLCS